MTRDPDRSAGQDRTTLSPRDAARLAGVGKTTIMRAIEGGNLEAQRDNRNQWRIRREALEAWIAARDKPDRDRTGPDRGPDHGAPREPGMDRILTLTLELGETRADAAAARATIAQLEAHLEDQAQAQAALARALEDRTRAAEADRDRWRALAERMAQPVAPAVPTRRWWPWRR